METLISFLLTLFLLLLVLEGEGRTMLGCTWRSSFSPTMPSEQKVWARRECESGNLEWYYPHGGLQAFFRHENSGRDFRLCIHSEGEAPIRRAYNETGPQREPLNVPNLDMEICIPSIGGKVQLYFQAPEVTVYVTTIKYTMWPP